MGLARRPYEHCGWFCANELSHWGALYQLAAAAKAYRPTLRSMWVLGRPMRLWLPRAGWFLGTGAQVALAAVRH